MLRREVGHLVLAGLRGSSPAFILARLREQLSLPFLVVTPDHDTAEELHRELSFYSGNAESILLFPPWETTPFDRTSPHPDTSGERLSTLFRLLDGKAKTVIASVTALSQKVLPRRTLGEVSQYLVTGEETDRESLIAKLVRLGYAPVSLVEDRSTFSVRGGIVDIFPSNLPSPVRIEFFGDFVETIRSFDPVTQRSRDPLPELVLLPSREIILSEDVVEGFAGRLKKRCDDTGIPADRRREIFEQVQQSLFPPGIEYLQPLFHPELETLFDYAGPGAAIVVIDPEGVTAAAERFQGDLNAAEQRALERDLITCRRDDLFLPPDQLSESLSRDRRIDVPVLELSPPATATVCRFTTESTADLKVDPAPDGERILKPLVDRLRTDLSERRRVMVACHQKGQAQRLYELLAPYGLPLNISDRSFPVELTRRDGKIDILIGDIVRGFRLTDQGLVVVAEEEIFGKRVKRRGVSEVRQKQILSSLAELKPGDYMVHIDFGVGVYQGLKHLSLGDIEGDFILLEYSGTDKLYLPVDRINLVQRYVGAEGLEPKTDKLGGSSWEKAKARAREAVKEMADELLKIYAAREVQQGHAFSPPDDLFREFEASFAFEETPDQLAAIEDVLRDMESSKPMDRLVCGDVGYGKTEVALRAAFKSVMDGKQAAVLVPTTILAQQHLETFRSRFNGYPVTVEMLSRFRTPKEQKAILEGVKKGEVDVVIGTHRLLQSDVQFKDLGLLIVDEEQRFGVVHKERLKKFRAVVDIMTLTATPIPRTLYMSIMGIRDLSIIDTPPVDRLAIKTFVARFNDEVIREAVMRELQRGGQVFFVHNRVQSIGAMAEHLHRVVPEAKVAVAHGQMDEKELEKIMLAFMHGEYNLLLCTTIIESGLDIPSANTLIVNRADTFGLAQLYQLRGRVGRSRLRAYAYFLIPGEGAISTDARDRLKILQDITELGAGFRIATHDLEIRGAGDILGAKQSGNIAAVGFELYTELMEEAIRTLKGEDLPERVDPEIKLRVPAFIPEDYVQNPNQRLIIYKKLSQAENVEEIDDVHEELADRFGKLPQAALYLLDVMKLKLQMRRMLIREVESAGTRIIFSFHQKTPVSPDLIIGLIRQHPKKYQFTPEFRLIVEASDTSFDGVIQEARNVLKRLG